MWNEEHCVEVAKTAFGLLEWRKCFGNRTADDTEEDAETLELRMNKMDFDVSIS